MSALGDGEWAAPQLRSLLRATIAGNAAIDAYEMELIRTGQPTLYLILNAHLLEIDGADQRRMALAVLDVTEIRKAKKAWAAAEREKDVLLRELQHRVANSLQIVSSFINIQANAAVTPEARVALKDTRQRVQTVSRLHRRLYTSEDIESVDLKEYLETVLSDLEDAWSTVEAPREIRFSAEPLRLPTDKAVSVGVVVNELVSNACKYAYRDGEPGEVRVSMVHADGELRIAIEDDGVGFSDDGAPKGTGVGTKLVDAMARSLSATVSYANDKGARVLLRVPVAD